jgi:hypothetical protein
MDIIFKLNKKSMFVYIDLLKIRDPNFHSAPGPYFSGDGPAGKQQPPCSGSSHAAASCFHTRNISQFASSIEDKRVLTRMHVDES